MSKFIMVEVILTFLLLSSLSYGLLDDEAYPLSYDEEYPVSTTTTTTTTTTDPLLSSPSTIVSEEITISLPESSTLAPVCYARNSYRVSMVGFTQSALFRLPILFIGVELLVFFVIRGIIAVYVYRRRLRKIYVLTHPPVLDEHYYDDAPPYALVPN